MRLKGFAAEVDFAHPDLFGLFDADFSESVLCLLRVAGCELNEFVAENLRRVITKHSQYKHLSRIVDAPTKNLRQCRFVRPEFRSAIRNVKRTQPVDLRVLVSKGLDFWDDCPDDFSGYIRGLNRLLPLVQEATAQHERFTTFGLTSLAKEIEDQLNKIMSASQDDRYYGFNRITMTTAAVILGHMLNVSFQPSKHGDHMYSRPFRCRLDCRQFSGNPHFDALDKDFPIGVTDYKPIVIPINQMERKSAQMLSLLQSLDNWPETQNKAIFDHFWVMTPDLNFTGNQELMYDLIEDGRLVGILLGEKDGDVFFVSYWM